MKKSLLFAAVATAMLASCSNDEVLQEAQNPNAAIGFEAFTNNATRATNETTTANLPQFQVWGGMAAKGTAGTTDSYGAIFTGDIVKKESGAWIYSPLRYWVAGNAYSFSALGAYQNNADAWEYTPEETITAGSFLTNYHGSLAFDQAESKGLVDLVWTSAKVDAATDNMLPVNLTFSHLLSQVNLKFVNCFPSDGATIEISNVSIQSATNGTLDFSEYASTVKAADMTWTTTGETGYSQAYKFTNGSATSTQFDNSATQSTEYFTVIPSQEKIQVNFHAALYSGSVLAGEWDHEHEITLNSTNLNALFKPGYKYTLVANLDADNIADNPLNPIEFTVVAVDGWQDAGVVDYLYSLTLNNLGKAEMANTADATVSVNVASMTPTAWDATAYSALVTDGCTYQWVEDCPVTGKDDDGNPTYADPIFTINPAVATALPATLTDIKATISLKAVLTESTTRTVNLYIKDAADEVIAKSVVAITVNVTEAVAD